MCISNKLPVDGSLLEIELFPSGTDFPMKVLGFSSVAQPALVFQVGFFLLPVLLFTRLSWQGPGPPGS